MIAFGLALLGLALGSFVNALVWRLQNKRDWVHERSECVNCGHRLSAIDLIPVLSWIILSGKCRYCKKPISIQYPLVELGTGLVFVISYVAWPKPVTGFLLFKFVAWLTLVVILMALAIYDLRTMLLPDKLVRAAAVVTAVYVLGSVTFFGFGIGLLFNSFFGLLAFGGVFYVLFQLSGGKWIGGGDVKLGFVLGAWLANPILCFLAIFLGSLIGTIFVVALGVRNKLSLNAKLPFGPLLILGTVVAMLYGERIIRLYMNLTINA